MQETSPYITVREMIEILKDLDSDTIIIMTSNDMANIYAPLVGIDPNCIYIPHGQYSGEVKLATLSDEDRKAGFTEDDVHTGADGKKAIVLVPVS